MNVQSLTLPFAGTTVPTGGSPVDSTSNANAPATAPGTSGAAGAAPDPSSGTQGTSSTGLVSQGSVPDDTNSAAARVEAAVQQILASSSTSLDSLDLLARVMIQQNGLQRHEALEDRMAARQAAMTDLLSQAQSMTKEAGQMMTSAIVSLVVGAVSAAVSFAGSAAGGIKSMKGAEEIENAAKLKSLSKDLHDLTKDMKGLDKLSKDFTKVEGRVLTTKDLKVSKMMDEIKDIKAVMAKAKKIESIIGAAEHVGQAAEHSGKFVDGNMQSQNKLLEAQQKTDEAQAQNQGSVEDQMKTTQQSLTDMCTQILSFLHDMQEAKAEGMAAFTRA